MSSRKSGVRGIFLDETYLTPKLMRSINILSRAENKNPKEYIIGLIEQDIENSKSRGAPIVERLIGLGIGEIKKRLL